MKDDGSFQVGGGPTALQRVLLARRSHRKYAPGVPSEEQLSYVRRCVELTLERLRLDGARLVILDGDEQRKAVIRAAMKGLVGKINPWLPFAKASHLMLCGAVYPAGMEREGIERTLKQASMAMQAAMLAAQEVGLATCWMAAINHEQVEAAYGMPDGARLVAMSPLGLPAKSMGLSWDAAVFHFVSKKRKPLKDLWYEESWPAREKRR